MTLKRYNPNEVPEDACCYDCHLPYGVNGWIETLIPNEVWEIIKPTEEGGGLLCINCISARCAEAGLSNVPIRFTGREPLIPVWAFPVAVKCKRCNTIQHITVPDMDGLLAFGWHFEEPYGWICPKHGSASYAENAEVRLDEVWLDNATVYDYNRHGIVAFKVGGLNVEQLKEWADNRQKLILLMCVRDVSDGKPVEPKEED